ncbi:MAG TPA: hypothetical protein DDW27_03055 [Bacteroidales bacterium]|nr:hypothetical protein [Bacteroidales bacterium]
MTDNKTIHNKRRRSLPLLIAAQLLIAVITVAIILIVGLKIKPLIEKKVELEQTVVSLERNKVNLENTIHNLERNVNELETRIRETTVFDRNRYQMNWDNAKMLLSGAGYKQERLIIDIIEMKYSGVGWKLNGYSPDVGFDSPSFAAWLLNKNEILLIEPSQRYRLPELLRETDNPGIGDLIFYDSGYAMFYFRDRNGHPFCIGMTPLGIVALEINFGPRLIKYGKLKY